MSGSKCLYVDRDAGHALAGRISSGHVQRGGLSVSRQILPLVVVLPPFLLVSTNVWSSICLYDRRICGGVAGGRDIFSRRTCPSTRCALACRRGTASVVTLHVARRLFHHHSQFFANPAGTFDWASSSLQFPIYLRLSEDHSSSSKAQSYSEERRPCYHVVLLSMQLSNCAF